MVLVDSHTYSRCWPRLAGFPQMSEAELLEVDPGEESKTMDVASQLWTSMVELGADRHAELVCLGGGMITDLGGFVAATFMRSVRCIYIPTSLLAMVDAAIGGKTGLNLNHTKNQIGTFTMPAAILICPGFLDTLPPNELRSGFAEMLKHGWLADADYFDALASIESLSPENLTPHIERSIRIKSDIVERDPKEEGERKHLNLGHTIGHAIESVFLGSEAPVSHGDAVAWGMVVEAHIAESMNLSSAEDRQQLEEAVRRHFPIIRLSADLVELAVQAMTFDKKNQSGEVRMVLPGKVGSVHRDIVVPEAVSRKHLQAIFGA